MSFNSDLPFAGIWIGSWKSDNGHSGEWRLTIDSTGKVTGIVKDSHAEFDGSLSGNIDRAGILTYEYCYGSVDYTGTGQISLLPEGILLVRYADRRKDNGHHSGDGMSRLKKEG